MGRPLPDMKNPHPTPIPFPSGIFLNFLSHPDSFRTLSRHSLIPIDVTLKPVIVAECGGSKLASRRSMGSTPNSSEIWSIPTSTAHLEFTAPCPLMAPLAGLFVQTLAPV